MDDKYQKLRAAARAVIAEGGNGWFDMRQALHEEITGEAGPDLSRVPETDMRHIAAASPKTILALLDERDALAPQGQEAEPQCWIRVASASDPRLAFMPCLPGDPNGWPVYTHPPRAEADSPQLVGLDDRELEDLAESAKEESLAFGLGVDSFIRLARTVQAKALKHAAQANAQRCATPER